MDEALHKIAYGALQDLEASRAEVAELLQDQPADLLHLCASMAAQEEHVARLREQASQAAMKLQMARDEKEKVLCIFNNCETGNARENTSNGQAAGKCNN